MRNAYFAHPESVPIAMLVDHIMKIRELALTRVKHARLAQNNNVRKFEIQNETNTSAEDYSNIIYWDKISVTEPPATRYMALEKLQEFVNVFQIGDESLFDFPNHIQAVERLVKLVTQTDAICEENELDMHVRTVLHTRDKHPLFSQLTTLLLLLALFIIFVFELL